MQRAALIGARPTRSSGERVVRGPHVVPAADALAARDILRLQRMIGNQALQRLLTLGEPSSTRIQRGGDGKDVKEHKPGADQLLVQDQTQVPQVGQVPAATVTFSGEEGLTETKEKVITTSKEIELIANWAPGPTAPNGHTPGALVGWIQNITYMNRQADYFDAKGYVESYQKEFAGEMIDGDDEKSPWYDPPRPYSEVAAGVQAALFGSRATGSGPVGIRMMDKPQVAYPRISPKGGQFERCQNETRFIAYLMIVEPDFRRGTVLEYFAWTYRDAYERDFIAEELRDEFADESKRVFDPIYAETEITASGKGVGPKLPNFEVSGPHGNTYFNDIMKPRWIKRRDVADRGRKEISLT